MICLWRHGDILKNSALTSFHPGCFSSISFSQILSFERTNNDGFSPAVISAGSCVRAWRMNMVMLSDSNTNTHSVYIPSIIPITPLPLPAHSLCSILWSKVEQCGWWHRGVDRKARLGLNFRKIIAAIFVFSFLHIKEILNHFKQELKRWFGVRCSLFHQSCRSWSEQEETKN